jgi:hypothetical protein
LTAIVKSGSKFLSLALFSHKNFSVAPTLAQVCLRNQAAFMASVIRAAHRLPGWSTLQLTAQHPAIARI